ncbi:MAG: hypothetical protein O7E52_29595, partial [Candidatus Poribacteria bacterium]|nr:hypothetical protein [Candidatus Poribacteria bacterium]
MGSGATADKPQSKCWYHDGSWWSVLFDGAEGSFFYRFADGMWRRQTFPDALIYPALPTRADVLSQGDTLFVLEWEAVAPRLYKYIYQSNLRRYHLIPGFPVRLNLPTGHETLVIARDSNSVSWLTFEHAGKVKAVCSNANDYLVWDVDGVKIAEGLKDDDIGSIIAFEGQIGVFWSNQNTQSLHFRVHRDGAPKETWERAELVARGGYVADDHINLARGTDGRIYAVTKTSVDDVEGPVNGPTQAQIV